MLSEGRQSQSITILATALALGLGLAVAGGCASGEDGGAPAAASDEPYPNLGTVPDRPATMTEEQRAQLEEGLVADNQQREYSEDVIEFQEEPAAPLAPPVETSADDTATAGLGTVAMPDTPAVPPSAVPGTSSSVPASVPSSVPSSVPASVPAAATAAASIPPTPSYTPPSASYTPVPSAPTAFAGDSSTADLNRAQLESLRTPAAAPTGTPPPAAPTGTSSPTALAAASIPAVPPMGAPAAVPTYTPPPATPGYTPPPAAPTYTAPPAAPAYTPPPAGVQEVFQARLQERLPVAPAAPLPPAGSLGGDRPPATVVVSSGGVASFDDGLAPPAVGQEPVLAGAGGVSQGVLSRTAVPRGSVLVATILFSDGSSALRGRERQIIRAVYDQYRSSGRNVRVVGHASSRTRNMDPVRHRMVNLGISADRANAVALELQRLGVPSNRITVVAAADDMPLYYEVMPSGEAGNRRTEIYLD